LNQGLIIMMLDADQSLLLIIDVQERLMPVMDQPNEIVRSIKILSEAASVLDMPVMITEQHPKALGSTIENIDANEKLNTVSRFEKMHFSAFKDTAFQSAIHQSGRRQVVVSGIESHICVLQTALDLVNQGYHVFIVADAVTSRTSESKKLALSRMANAGAEIVNAEMVLFEWLGKAGTDQFRSLSKLIK